MPIYEYWCPQCGEDFEKLVFSTTVVTCPMCGSDKPKKKFSVFGMSGVEVRGGGSSGCSSCSSSNCRSCK